MSKNETVNWETMVRQMRQSLQLSQGAFAKLLGVSQPALSKWERGIDTPSLEAKNKIIDLTSKDKRAFRDVSVICQARFAPLPIHIFDRNARIIEMSDSFTTDCGRSRSELMSAEGSMMGRFGEMVDDTIERIIGSGFFDSGIIGVSAQAEVERPSSDSVEKLGVVVWVNPIFLSDGGTLASCSHKVIPLEQVTNPGVIRSLHIDHVTI